MKNVLIVDDESEIVESLAEYLTEKGFKVIPCTASEQALDIYQKQKPDLILSDIKMPGLTGLELFDKCKAKSQELNTKTPFVLMTGHADIIGVEKAFSLGVSELIAKPFDMDSINLVINYLLDLEESKGTDARYYSVPINDFMCSRASEYNIYLKIGDRHVLVTKSGQEFTEQRVQNFARKGVESIYLNAQDFAKYTDMQFAIANKVATRPLDAARKAKLVKHLLNSVGQRFIYDNVDKVAYQQAQSAFEAYTHMIVDNAQMNTMLSHLMLSGSDLAEKSALRALLSVMVVNHWRWHSPKIQSRVMLSALLCDISLKNYPQLLSKKMFEYNEEERELYEKHPIESYNMLRQIQDIPEEVLVVALQHHENSVGLGFPQKLNRDKQHPFTKVTHCVDEFIEKLLLQKDEKKDPAKALNHLYTTQTKMISDQVLKTLYLVFNVPLPKSYEGLLLPDQTSRVI